MSPTDADGMANNVDPDQTAPLGAVWSGSTLFAQTCQSENLGSLWYMLQEFSKLCGDTEQLMMLLERINSTFVRTNNSVLQALMRLIPFLAFGEADKMLTLINHFKPYLDFNKWV